MIITSSAFDDGGMIPKKFTCDGNDINPELWIQNVPAEAKGLALIVHDPDAPMPGGFTHWTVWNIDPQTTLIKDESTPPGSVEGNNSAKKLGYTSPCPPPGAPHHYHFYLYALDDILNLPEGAEAASLQKEIDKHSIAKAELVGLYGRGKE
jgi:Raf kinase inhibitor-like YbhB/YbcL family protein